MRSSNVFKQAGMLLLWGFGIIFCILFDAYVIGASIAVIAGFIWLLVTSSDAWLAVIFGVGPVTPLFARVFEIELIAVITLVVWVVEPYIYYFWPWPR